MTKISEWINATRASDSIRAVSKRAGLSTSTLARQIQDDTVTPETVVAIARAYDGNLLAGLVAAGLITEVEAHRAAQRMALHEADERDLIRELARRVGMTVEGSPESEIYDEPVSQVLSVVPATPDPDRIAQMAALDTGGREDIEREQEETEREP
jgi:AraC-like DNA-binding protein